MKFQAARFFGALVISGTLLSGLAGSASALSAFDIAFRAYRGELPNVVGHNQLAIELNSRNVTVKDIIRAAGETPTPELEAQVRSNLRSITNNQFHNLLPSHPQSFTGKGVDEP